MRSKFIKQAVIFDMDGTLLNTLEDLADGVNFVLNESGFPVHEMQRYHDFIGHGKLEMIANALPEKNRDECTIQKFTHRFNQVYSDRLCEKTCFYDGMDTVLSALEERGIRKAILSNKDHDFVVRLRSAVLSRWSFEAVLGKREGVPYKPDPSAALEIAKSLELPPENCAFVGDSGVDMHTARNAGMVAVGVAWGFRPAAELLEEGAVFLVEKPTDLLELSLFQK